MPSFRLPRVAGVCLFALLLTSAHTLDAQQQRRGGQQQQQQPGAPPSAQPPAQTPSDEPGPAASQRVEVAGPAEEKISTTSHSITLDGREIKYTATTGTLPIRLDDGKVAARMFFVAYSKD